MKRILLTIFTLFSAIATFAGSGGPDGYGYTWRDSRDPLGPTYAWFDISVIGTPVTGLADDNIVGPFAMSGFQYYWYTPEKFWIGSNGYIIFNKKNQLASPFPTAMPLTAGANDYIGPMVSDLNFTGRNNQGRCYRYDQGDTLCVTWENVPFWTNNANGWTGANSFQIILKKSTKQIIFNYKRQQGTTQSNDLIIGIENIAGNLGLQHSRSAYPDTNYTVVYNYPSVVTYQATDAGINWNMDDNDGAFFVGNGASNISISANVKNYGNVSLSSIPVATKITDPIGLVPYNVNSTVPGLMPGIDNTVTYATKWSVTSVGRHILSSGVNVTGDLIADNNITNTKVISVDTTTTMTLDYSDGIPDGTGLSWNGGNGGVAVYIQPPCYPVKISSTQFYIASASPTDSFNAKIFKDDGPNGAPGTLLDSVLVTRATMTTGGYTIVPTANQNLMINSGGVYLFWEMVGTTVQIARDTTFPICRRSYEVLSGSWASYRANNDEEFCMGIICAKTFRRDIANAQILSPTPGFSLTATPLSVAVKIKNPSPDPSVAGVVKYKMGNGSVVSQPFNLILQPGDSTNVIFTNQLSKNNATSGNLCIWVEMPNDQNKGNDTLCISGTVVGVKDQQKGNVTVYPIPATADLNISLGEVTGAYQITITDLTGKLILRKSGVATGNTQEHINLEAFAKGIYLYRIEGNDLFVTGKFVKE